ncbi:hypothetical protein C8035_v011016 [Colletotrichum spinosum]|uniref:Uncharacterized protein n=1 Tax=Colletotrichum spinosum TaxID=1347390 RepID=A0A4R8Q670_9PEZI|nr:hypothetical protein C8035_v011016 [Colletotrichum spinosum]
MATALTTSSTSTNTYRSVVVTSFPFNPLTTQFAAPTYCNDIYSGDIYMIGPQNECRPSSHHKEETAYFSPGYVCPEGYMTAKVDNKGVHSITTVTCCPYRSDIILSAVDPATLSGQWAGLFCTWIAPEPTRIDIVHTTDTRTWTEQEYVASPGGVNAYGVRMVYQSSDLASASAASASLIASTSATPTSTGELAAESTEASSSSLPTGVSIGIAAAVPVIALALIGAALFWWWRKRQASKYNRVNEANAHTHHAGPGMPPGDLAYQGGAHQPPPVQQQQYPDPHQAFQQQAQHQNHQPPLQSLHSTQSFPSMYQASNSQQSSAVPYTQQYGHGGAYTSFVGYKPPGSEDSPSMMTGQSVPTPELPAPVQRGELAEEHTSSAMHVDHQKMMGVPMR